VSSPRWLVSLPILASLACGSGSARRDGSRDAAIGRADTATDQSADVVRDSGDGRDGVETDGPPDGPRDVGAEIPDDGGSGSDVPIPQCVQSGSLYFAAPQPVSVPGGGFEFAIAATTKGKLGAMARWSGRTGLFYFDSLDGGRSFRPAMQLSSFPFMNFRIAAGRDHIYLAAGGYDDSVILWLAPFANLSDPTQFTTIQIGPYGNYVGQPVAGRDGRVAMLLQNDTLGGGPITGQYISTASTPIGPFSEPRRLFWPPTCAAGLYHSNGSLFMTYGMDNLNIGQQMQMRWSADNGATFSDAVFRLTSGGRAWCHQLYELGNGTALAVSREGTQQVVAVPIDPMTNQFGQPQVIANGYLSYADSARTGTGRLYVSITTGDSTNPIQATMLTFSDDEGQTWSPPQALLGIEAGECCPKLAASDDELYFLWGRGQTLMFGRAGNKSACDEATGP
jgi:hypothetical protein